MSVSRTELSPQVPAAGAQQSRFSRGKAALSTARSTERSTNARPPANGELTAEIAAKCSRLPPADLALVCDLAKRLAAGLPGGQP
jgi:hypothetical protein